MHIKCGSVFLNFSFLVFNDVHISVSKLKRSLHIPRFGANRNYSKKEFIGWNTKAMNV